MPRKIEQLHYRADESGGPRRSMPPARSTSRRFVWSSMRKTEPNPSTEHGPGRSAASPLTPMEHQSRPSADRWRARTVSAPSCPASTPPVVRPRQVPTHPAGAQYPHRHCTTRSPARARLSNSALAVERSFAWAARFRRLARDYGRLPQTLAGFHFPAVACLMPPKIFDLIHTDS